MSSNAQQSPYPRQNYWGGDDTDDDSDEPELDAADYGSGDGPKNNPGPAGRFHGDPNDRAAIVAHELLRESATMLCSTTLRDAPDRGWTDHMAAEGIDDAPDHDPNAMHHERGEVELTEPILRPPTDTAFEQRYRRRLNPEQGYVSGGHSTGVWIQDRPEDELLEIVREWLVGAHGDLRERKRQQVLDRARRQKRQGDKRDVDVLRNVVELVEELKTGRSD